MGRKTATSVRASRPDLATGYDEKIHEARGILKDLTAGIREAREEYARIQKAIQAARQEAVMISQTFTASLEESSRIALTEWKGQFQFIGERLTDKISAELQQNFEEFIADEQRRQIEEFGVWIDKLTRAIAFGIDGREVCDSPDMTTEEAKAWSIVLAAALGGRTNGLDKDSMEAGPEWGKELLEAVIPAIRKELETIIEAPGSRQEIPVPPEAYPILFEAFDKNTGKRVQRATVREPGHRVKIDRAPGQKLRVRLTLKTGRVIEKIEE